MEPDPTEGARRRLLAQINSHAVDRSGLEARHGRVWDAVELARDFEVLARIFHKAPDFSPPA